LEATIFQWASESKDDCKTIIGRSPLFGCGYLLESVARKSNEFVMEGYFRTARKLDSSRPHLGRFVLKVVTYASMGANNKVKRTS
jgi:hypothetical protein